MHYVELTEQTQCEAACNDQLKYNSPPLEPAGRAQCQWGSGCQIMDNRKQTTVPVQLEAVICCWVSSRCSPSAANESLSAHKLPQT